MKRHASVFVVFALLAGLLLPRSTNAMRLPHEPTPTGTNITGRLGTRKLDAGLRGKSNGAVQVMIELEDEPTVLTYARTQANLHTQSASVQAATAATTQFARINRVQQQMIATFRPLNATVLYQVQRAYNGVAVRVDASQLAALADTPGVKAIHQLVPKHLDNASSVPLIGAPQLWAGAGNTTGKGIRIGIIDTGIDYTHRDFGGNGTADFNANNRTSITDNVKFPTTKVVGGIDLVGDTYNADPNVDDYQPVPHPDPDPIDCAYSKGGGHGTHVAGTAAGYGENADGSTYTGAYNTAIDFNSLKIGPGVAPEASLYAIRVFGCGGSTNVVAEAIDYAVDPNGDGNPADHLDVINMSLGSAYGSVYDPDNVASENATKAGVVVVTSAGNEGDAYYIVGTPSTTDSVLSVAASADATDVLDGIKVNTPSAIVGNLPASFSIAYDWDTKADVTGNVVYPSSQASGCDTFNSSNAAAIKGKIALLDWTEGGCGSVARTAKVVAAGGIGAILVDDSDVFDLSITGSDTIPSVSMPKSTGAKLKANLTNLNITFTNSLAASVKYTDENVVDTLALFSSRGVRRGGILKPDIAAPGLGTFSAKAGTGSAGVSENGTSMAAPHITGSMALLKQLHPDWTVQQLKALAMNTATKDVRSDLPANAQIESPMRVGAGRVNLPNAASQSVIAYDAAAPNLVSVSFGNVEVVTTTTIVKQVALLNKGTDTATFNLGYTPVSTIPGVSYSIAPAQVTLAGGATVTATVTMSADASKMNHAHDSTIALEDASGLARNWVSEAAGYMTMTVPAANTPALRLPLYVAARQASDMQAKQHRLQLSSSTTSSATLSLGLQGTSVGTGTFPSTSATTEHSTVTAFELQYKSPAISASGDVDASADLRYVGVSDNSSIQKNGVPDSEIYFGIATNGNWATPNTMDFEIYIDVNRDGKDDFVLFNTNDGTTGSNDVFVSELYNIKNKTSTVEDYINGVDPGVLDTVPFNTSTMVIPVLASDLGLTATSSTFSYQVVANSNDVHDADYNYIPVDYTPYLTYNVAKPGIAFKNMNSDLGFAIYADKPDTTISVAYNRANYLANNSLGVLLLHHHNRSGQHAEAVLGPQRLLLPLVTRKK